MNTWAMREGRLCLMSAGGVLAEVRPTPEGRWSAMVGGKPLCPSGRPGTLLTWETPDGARAHIERTMRSGGPWAVSAFRGPSRAGETLGTFAPFNLGGYGPGDDDENGGAP